MTRQEKIRQSLIKRYGSYEAYQEHMRSIAKKGGSKTGETKRRSPEFYQKLSREGVKARWRKQDGAGKVTGYKGGLG